MRRRGRSTEIAPGDKRTFVPPSRRDPHLVLRINDLTNDYYIKYADKTTEWRDWAYPGESRPYESEPVPIVLDDAY